MQIFDPKSAPMAEITRPKYPQNWLFAMRAPPKRGRNKKSAALFDGMTYPLHAIYLANGSYIPVLSPR